MEKETKVKPVKKRISKKTISIQEKKDYLNQYNRTNYSVELFVPYIPTSINKLYFNNRYSGGRSLTTEGKVFKSRVTEYIASNYLPEIMKFNRRAMFNIRLIIYLPVDSLFTLTYITQKGIKTPYRKRDLGNMEKVLIDCIKEFCMEDDCQIFSETLEKHVTDNKPGVLIKIEEIFPFNGEDNENCIDLMYKIRRYQSEDQ
jgi:Holliday junction resolvase RusA-like endonuclease